MHSSSVAKSSGGYCAFSAIQRDRLVGFAFGCMVMGLLTVAALTANQQHPHRILANSLSAVHSHLRHAFDSSSSINADVDERSQLQIHQVELASEGLRFRISLNSEAGDSFVSDLSKLGSVSITLPRNVLYAAGMTFSDQSQPSSQTPDAYSSTASTERSDPVSPTRGASVGNAISSTLSTGNTINRQTDASPVPVAPSPPPSPAPAPPQIPISPLPPVTQQPTFKTAAPVASPPPSSTYVPRQANQLPVSVPPTPSSAALPAHTITVSSPSGSVQNTLNSPTTQSGPASLPPNSPPASPSASFVPNSPVTQIPKFANAPAAPIASSPAQTAPVLHSPLRGWQPPRPTSGFVSLVHLPRTPYRNYSIFSFPDAAELKLATQAGLIAPAPSEEEMKKGIHSRKKPPTFVNEQLGQHGDPWPFASQAEKAAVREQGFQKKAKRYDWCRDCVDVVIPYVNGSDAWYLEEIAKYKSNPGQVHRDGLLSSRFRDHDELVYAIRAIFALAPFVRYIHIVTNGPQRPEWLVPHPRVHIVNHESIFRFPEHLPTFNVFSIKQHLHRIPDLAPKFFYVEDDHFLYRGFKLSSYYDFAQKMTYIHTAKGLAVTDQVRFDDNSEWMALRKAFSLLKRLDPAVRADYPAHVATFLHREIYRAALEDEWRTESYQASAERFRGPNAIETRLLAPVYQKIRAKGPVYVDNLMKHPSSIFSRLFDLDSDNLLDAEELLGLADFMRVPLSQLRTMTGGRCPLSMDDFNNLVKPPTDANAVQNQPVASLPDSPFAAALRQALYDLEASHSAVENSKLGDGWGFVEMNNEHTTFEQRLVEYSKINDLMICINDGLSEANPSSMSEVVMREFLEWTYPNMSPVEDPVYAQARLDEARKRAAKENRLIPSNA